MKKIRFSILGCVMLFCFCGNLGGTKALCTPPPKINDTVYFFQKCIDTVRLPIYQPTDEGKYFLDKILDSRHQNLIKFPQGIFVISEEGYPDAIWSISYSDVNINFFAQYGWNSFKGIVYYKEYTFLIKSTVRDTSTKELFKNTQQKKGFPEYSDKLYVKIDEKILWRLVKRDGQYLITSLYPPTTEIDIDVEDFK